MDEIYGFHNNGSNTSYNPNDFDSQYKLLMDQINTNNSWSAEQAQKQMDFQERMSNTAHQREVADLKAAGLNPVLSASRGASTPNGASATAEASSGSLTALMSNFAANALETAKFEAERAAKEEENNSSNSNSNGVSNGVYNKYHSGDDGKETDDYSIGKFLDEHWDLIYGVYEKFKKGEYKSVGEALKDIWNGTNIDVVRAVFDYVYDIFYIPNPKSDKSRARNETLDQAKDLIWSDSAEKIFEYFLTFDNDEVKPGETDPDVNEDKVPDDITNPNDLDGMSFKDRLNYWLTALYAPDKWMTKYGDKKKKDDESWSQFYWRTDKKELTKKGKAMNIHGKPVRNSAKDALYRVANIDPRGF